MDIRKEIVDKINSLPEGALPEVYDFVEKIAVGSEGEGILRRLQKIRIVGPPDFSENFELYASGEKKFE